MEASYNFLPQREDITIKIFESMKSGLFIELMTFYIFARMHNNNSG